MRNVRCAGNGDPRRKVQAPAPCGWKGERFPNRLGTHRSVFYDQVKAIAKPCPRCGGRVELIP